MSPFTTDDLAGMSILFVQEEDGKHQFPHFADEMSGYMPNWGENGNRHPLQTIEIALRQDLHTTFQSLRMLSCKVGQAADSDRRGKKIYKWERETIADAFKKVKSPAQLEKPKSNWGRADFANYYKQIRDAEAKKLRSQVIELAGHIVTQNELQQLYIAKENNLAKGTGWLAPLIGLSVNTTTRNTYFYQVHDVVPVVQQQNGKRALLNGAGAGLYTAFAPLQGHK